MVMILVVAAVAAAASGKWLLMLPAGSLAIAFNLWAWPRADMWPISEKGAETAKAASWTMGILYVVLSLFQ
jgi:hypothetical protein